MGGINFTAYHVLQSKKYIIDIKYMTYYNTYLLEVMAVCFTRNGKQTLAYVSRRELKAGISNDVIHSVLTVANKYCHKKLT